MRKTSKFDINLFVDMVVTLFYNSMRKSDNFNINIFVEGLVTL